MSRSKRKTPVRGMTRAASDKEDKQRANRRLRRRVKEELATDEEVLTHEREVGSPWVFAKDGKARFDPEEWPAGMRK